MVQFFDVLLIRYVSFVLAYLVHVCLQDQSISDSVESAFVILDAYLLLHIYICC